MVAKISKKCSSSVYKYVDEYIHDLVIRGYSKSTLGHYKSDLLKFIAYTEKHGINSAKRFSTSAEELLNSFTTSRWVRRTTRTTMYRFIEHLVLDGIIPEPKKDSPKTRYANIIMDFVKFQVEHRGICSGYSTAIHRYCNRFGDYVQNRGFRRLATLTPEVVLDFITEDSKHYVRKTVSYHCSVLRTFLTYLYRKNYINRNLVGVVLAPRLYKNEACPKFISTSQINDILFHIDRSTSIGLRDYAMILLLATYGLRGIEVIRLCLDDIDWRRKIIHIKGRKAGNNSDYPLASSVAEALVEYLQKARPKSKNRHIFLSVKTPHRSMIYTWGMGDRVRQYMRKANIEVNRPGAHTFRYSCAQILLNNKTPLKVISDYLGHTQTETTQLYIKISIEDLREVACGSGEEIIL
jgi:site-specific recombinase XerD